jgi:myosin heavy subunit
MPEKTDAEKLKDQETEIARLRAESTKADERVANAEKKFQEWSGEVGGIRKVGEELKVAIEEAKKNSKELQDLIAALKSGKKAPGESASEHKAEEGTPDEILENVEKALDENQRKAVEAAFVLLSDAEKLRYQNDLEFRIAFLKRAQDAAPAIPGSPWKTAPKKNKPGDESAGKDVLDRVFNKKRRNAFTPAGPQGGAPVLGGNDTQEPNEPPEDTRTH